MESEYSQIACVFPGQGTQVKGMGKALLEKYQSEISCADEILGYSLYDLCVNDSGNRLGNTQYAQPAIYTINALTYMDSNGSAKKPDYLLGHSLGEYNALLAANVFSYETGLKMVKRRGELMSQAEKGAMAAVIGIPKDRIMEVILENYLEHIFIANLNSPLQTVIAGKEKEMTQAESIFKELDEAPLYINLNVSGAFHSPLMESAMENFKDYIADIQFNEPDTKVIANVNAEPYRHENIRTNLANQITSPVQWVESISWLNKANPDLDYVEIGESKVLSKMIEQIIDN